ncbi:MAG TPA: hypothetical protein VN736_29585 [Candidatus Limnocylindrales bacterium]|nr:hypothetical protein [Candidatus Limnocylindrales bacterium]
MRAPYICIYGLFVCTAAVAQTDTPSYIPTPSPEAPAPILPAPAPVTVPLNEERILKVIPDYQTVENSHQEIAPMSAREKWHLAFREVVDPFNVLNAAVGAAMSQAGNETPKYGEGGRALAKRFGASLADFSSQSFLATGVFATLLHQDPRYFREGPPSGIFKRTAKSLEQIVVARTDSGAQTVNAANFLGMAAGIGLSNVYYPSASRTGSVMASRITTCLTSDVLGNLMSEFWPDIQKKFFRKKSKN